MRGGGRDLFKGEPGTGVLVFAVESAKTRCKCFCFQMSFVRLRSKQTWSARVLRCCHVVISGSCCRTCREESGDFGSCRPFAPDFCADLPRLCFRFKRFLHLMCSIKKKATLIAGVALHLHFGCVFMSPLFL